MDDILERLVVVDIGPNDKRIRSRLVEEEQKVCLQVYWSLPEDRTYFSVFPFTSKTCEAVRSIFPSMTHEITSEPNRYFITGSDRALFEFLEKADQV